MENNHIADVTIKGELTLKTVGKVKETLLQISNQAKVINLHFIDCNQIDLSGIQLITSFSKTLKKLNKKLKIDAKINEETQKLLANNGFEALLSTKN